jgi:hypothetical protein
VTTTTRFFRVGFYFKIDFQGCHVTYDGILILVRRLAERLGLGELIEQQLT